MSHGVESSCQLQGKYKYIKDLSSIYIMVSKRICNVLPTPKSTPKRILIEFTVFVSALEESELIIEEFGRHQYSADYKDLINEFLLDK
mgnify:CR=1 FL=1